MEPVLLNNRYRLLDLVGSGGMAVIYKGVDTLLQRRVAVKVLRERFASDPAFLARFQREAQAAANLDHPNVVTVYDVGHEERGNRHYIVMEYVDGQDLKTRIRQRERLSINEALDVTAQICAGVGHAHKANLIHCDIKPQNVLVTRDGRVKVADFGIARALSESGLTESETVWGSPLYLSPEQAAGEPPSPASDVYSIGVVMYEMLAGSPPFQAEKPAALALMHMRDEPPPLTVHNSQVPPRLDWIVRKLLAKEPSARYRTAEQLAHVLEEYRKHGEQPTGWQPAVPSGSPSTLSPLGPQSSLPARAAPDGLTWVLGIIAFIAVVGLIPLWGLVYQSYSASPTLPPTPTPTPWVTQTPEVQPVSVPDVVDRPVDEARRMVEQAGLRFVIAEKRDEPDVVEEIVLEQDPTFGERIPLDSEVSVVVSIPRRKLTMPRVTGYQVETIQEGLESDGLLVSVEEVWSAESEGIVVAQIPEPDATIYAGDQVTLTVSGGMDAPIPLEVNLANLIMLESAELQRKFQAGEALGVTLYWRALRSVDTNYTVFVHLIGPDGRLVAQRDEEPHTPTTAWVSGVQVVDSHGFTVPVELQGGRYQLRVGMYPQGQSSARLSVADSGFTNAESDSILIAEIEIQP
jgi:serine/threonine-protein kinase